MTHAFCLNEQQIAIQDAAQRFTADAITPHAARWDEEHHFPA
jgi:alkylation response protein AidB-like acyl-CoA dehydrogenase